MKLAIGIATSRRPAILKQSLDLIAAQSLRPDLVVICPTEPDDIAPESLSPSPYPICVVSAPAGLPKQRNAILAAATGMDALIFIDDDFFLDRTYVAHAKALLENNPDVVLATGTLIEDGIHGPGLDPEDAARKLADHAHRVPASGALMPHYGVYGCNMVVRLHAVRQLGVRFDERLPLYAWQEDIDFSRQLAPAGLIVKTPTLCGIHLGSKRGRTSGLKLGYSQIANPVYLMQKGTMSVGFASKVMGKNLIANLVRSLNPEPYIDRWGRCRGNWLAVFDMARGRIDPARILEI